MSKEIIFKAILEDGEFKAKLSEIEQASAKADDGIRTFEQGARSLGQQLKTGAGISEFNKAADEVNKTLNQQTKNVKQTATNITAYGKAVNDTANKQQSLTSRARQLRNELVALELAGKRDTEQFRQLSNEAARLNDAIGDVSRRTKALASDTASLDAFAQGVQGIAGGFAAAQGFAALFGKENEDVQKALLKVQATLAIVNGLQAVFNTLNKDSAFLTIANAKATGVVTSAYKLLGIQVNTTTTAFKALRAVTIGLGIGAIVAVVSSLASAFSTLKDEAEEADKAITTLDDTLEGFGRAALNADQVIGRIRTGIGGAGISVRELKNALSELESELENFTPENVAIIGPVFGEDEPSPEEIKKRIADAAKKELNELRSNIALIQKEIEKRTDETAKKVFNKQVKINDEFFRIALQSFNESLDEEDRLRNESNQKRIQALTAFNALSKKEQEQNQQELNNVLIRIEEQLQADILKLQEERLRKQEEEAIRSAERTAETLRRLNLDLIRNEITALDNQVSEIRLKAGENTALQISGIDEIIQLEKQRFQSIRESLELQGASAEDIRAAEIDSLNEINRLERERLGLLLQIFDAGVNLTQGVIRLQANQNSARIQQIQEQAKAELDAFTGTEEQKARLQARFEAQERAAKEKAAKDERDAALFSAIINGISAVIKAGGLLTPLGFLTAKSVALQVAAIRSQPLPRFAEGGIIEGKSHAKGGVRLEAEGGEFITNKRQTKKHRDLLEAVNSSDTKLNDLIFKKFVLPEMLGLNKQQSIMVNASLKSDRIESELRKSRKQEIENAKMLAAIFRNNQSQSIRYKW